MTFIPVTALSHYSMGSVREVDSVVLGTSLKICCLFSRHFFSYKNLLVCVSKDKRKKIVEAIYRYQATVCLVYIPDVHRQIYDIRHAFVGNNLFITHSRLNACLVSMDLVKTTARRPREDDTRNTYILEFGATYRFRHPWTISTCMRNGNFPQWMGCLSYQLSQ